MLLKELVLTSLDSYADFEVNGETLNSEKYLKLANKEVENFYLDVEDGQAKCIVSITE